MPIDSDHRVSERLIAGALLAITIGLSACNGNAAGEARPTETPAVYVETALVVRGNVEVAVEAVGTLQPNQRVEIRARNEGLVAAVLVIGSASLAAHHSAIQFDFTKSTPVTGVVKKFIAINPHMQLVLHVKDAKGERDIEFEGHSTNNMYRAGYRDNMIKVGDTIRWVWVADFHSVSFRMPGIFDSQDTIDYFDTQAGLVLDHTFNDIGVFDYYCIPHEFSVPPMLGVVRVVGDEPPPPDPVIPEPSSLALLSLGGLGALGVWWRRRRR